MISFAHAQGSINIWLARSKDLLLINYFDRKFWNTFKYLNNFNTLNTFKYF